MRFWLYNQHGGRFLTDRSYMGNLAELMGSDQSKLIDNTDDDGTSFTRNVNWFVADQHIRVHDNPNVQIQNIHQTETGFTIFLRLWVPFHADKVLTAKTGVLFSKIDNEQVTFAYTAQMRENGDIYFIVKDDSREYTLFSPDSITIPLSGTPDFAEDDFNSLDFFTLSTPITIPDIIPYDDLAFSYEFATHRMQLIKNGVIIADTNNNPESTGLVGWWRLVEGGDIGDDPDDPQTFTRTAFNSVETGNNGTITSGLTWSSIASNEHEVYLSYPGTGDEYVSVPNYAGIQDFSAITISLWFHPRSIPTSGAHTLINKNETNPGRIIIFIDSSGNLNFSLKNDAGTSQTALKASAFPDLDTWYHIVARWSDGNAPKITIDDVTEVGGTSLVGPISTGTAALTIGRLSSSQTPDGYIHDVKIWNRELSDGEVTTLFDSGHPHAGLPKWEANPPPPPEVPEPITNPFIKIYDLPKPSSNWTWQKLHKLVASGFTQVYQTDDGVTIPEESVPFSTVYEVTDSSGGLSGGGGGSGSTVYDPTADPGANHLEFEDGISRAGVRFDSGNSHLNKIVTRVVVKFRKQGSPGGTASVGIRTSSGSFVLLGTFSPGSFGSGEQTATINAGSNTYQMQANDIVSVEYPSGSNTIELTYATGGVSGFTSLEYDGSWSTFNDGGSTDIAMTIDAATAGGGGSGTGYPLWNPCGHSGGTDCNFGNWIESDVTHVGALIDSSSAEMRGEKLTKLTVKLSKVGSPSGGVEISTANSGITSSSRTVWGTVSSSELSGTPADFTFTKLDNTDVMNTGDAVSFRPTNCGGDPSNHFVVHASDSSQEVGVHLDYRIWNKDKRCFPNGGYTIEHTSQDITGKFEIGGTTVPEKLHFYNLDGGIIRAVGEVLLSGSVLDGEKITRVKPKLKAVGNPTGTIRCKIRNSSGSEVSNVGSIEADTVSPTSFEEKEFTNLFQSRTLTTGDKIMIQYTGTSTDYIQIMIKHDEEDPVGGERVQTLNSSGTFTDVDADLSGTIFVGGTATDPDARERVGEKAETADSILKLTKPSKALIWLRKVGIPPNDVFLRIRRQSDDSTRAVVGQIPTSSITTNSAGAQEEFTNSPVSIYAMQENDYILVEYADGDDNNYVEVAVTTTDQIDSTDSILLMYDSLFTNYDILTNQDLIATIWEGGDTFTPTGDEIPPPPPPKYTHDLHIYGGGYPYDYYTDISTIENWVGAISPDIRWYRKILTTNELTNIFDNRRDRANIPKGQAAVIGFFSLPSS